MPERDNRRLEELKRFGSDLTFSLGVLFLELSGLNYGYVNHR